METWITALTPLRSSSAPRTCSPQGRGRPRRPPLDLSRVRRASQPSPPRCAPASGSTPGDRVAYLCPNTPELLVAHFAVPLAGAVLVAINTRLATEEVRNPRPLRAPGCWWSTRRRASTVAPLPDALETVREDRHGHRPGRPRRGGDPGGRPPTPTSSPRGSDEPLLPWTVEDERPRSRSTTPRAPPEAQGRDVHPPGRLPERLGEVLHSEHRPDTVYLWTLPMFHCNGWCTAWARDRDRRPPGVPARGARRPHLAAHRAGGRHAPERRARRARRPWSTRRRHTRSSARWS